MVLAMLMFVSDNGGSTEYSGVGYTLRCTYTYTLYSVHFVLTMANLRPDQSSRGRGVFFLQAMKYSFYFVQFP